MMGVYAKRPSLPKYNSIWDVQIVLNYIESLTKTTLLQLTEKLCMLFLLVTAQRCQTLHLIELDDIVFEQNICIIKTNHVLKQTRPGHHLDNIQLKSYQEKRTQCLITIFKEYINRTQSAK